MGKSYKGKDREKTFRQRGNKDYKKYLIEEKAHCIMTIDECESLNQDDYMGKSLNETVKTKVESLTTQNADPNIITQDDYISVSNCSMLWTLIKMAL